MRAREGDDWFEVRPVILPNGEPVATVKGWSPAPIALDYDKCLDVLTTGWQHTIHGAPIPPLRTLAGLGDRPAAWHRGLGSAFGCREGYWQPLDQLGLLFAAGVIVATHVTKASAVGAPPPTRQGSVPSASFGPLAARRMLMAAREVHTEGEVVCSITVHQPAHPTPLGVWGVLCSSGNQNVSIERHGSGSGRRHYSSTRFHRQPGVLGGRASMSILYRVSR